MLSLGAFAFAAPGMLALLLVLPVIYWLLRMIPPLPKLVRFPAIRLLIGLEPTEQTPMKMPWWLLLLRLLLATALILAVARPLLNPQADLPGKGPLMLVIDDGWSSAPGWTTRIAHAERLIQRAERAQRPVVLTGTAPLPLDAPAAPSGAMRPDEARTILRAFRPKPWPTDRAAAVTAIDQMQVDPGAYVVWLSDGLEDEGTPKLTERLRKFDGLQVLLPDQAATPLLLLPPVAEGRDLKVQALRPAADGPRKIAVQAADDRRPHRRPHRSRLRRHRHQGRRRAADAARAAQPHGPARHRDPGRRGLAPCCSTSAIAAGRSPSWASGRPRAASRCCRRSTSSSARSIPMSACRSAIARRC